ncbi:hypothetical protein FPOA_11653 [Fusarium poae]|uniref:Uncharacterized protein n=1 Tax=Fusarium poae TaxID=36050 RepID=A0A1B8AH94_FUSPO|nr:hypothetical protein FPOA_11653 [Fusarium poae]
MTIFQPNLTFRDGGHQGVGYQVQSESWIYHADACGRPPGEVQQSIICATCFITESTYLTGSAGSDWDLFSTCCPFSGGPTTLNKTIYYSATTRSILFTNLWAVPGIAIEMDRLAPEIISNIVSHLYYDGKPLHPDICIAPLAVLCRHWQPLVEAQTFRRLRLDETFRFPIRGGSLTPTRLSYIRKLVCVIPQGNLNFPAPFDRWQPGNLSEMIIEILFHQLAKIPLREEPLLDLELVISISNSLRSDYRLDPVVGFALPDLSELPMVRSLMIGNGLAGIVPSPRAIFYMASKMPRLRELRAFFSVPESRTSSVHQRIELGQSLSMLPTSIHKFKLQYLQHQHLADGLLAMQDGEDFLTRELRRFSQREGLKDFAFHGCVEPSIFWPPASDASDPRHWPTLKSFVLGMYNVQELSCLRANEPLSNSQDEENWDRVYAHGACPKWNTTRSTSTTIGTDLEIEDETVREWRKAAEACNVVFKVRLGQDDDEQYDAFDAFKFEEIVEKEVEELESDESSEDEVPPDPAVLQRLQEQSEARALIAANFYPHIPLGG